MSFEAAPALLALLLVPLAIAGYVLVRRRWAREAKSFAEPSLLPNIVDPVPAWRRRLPVALLLLAVTGFLIGMARPHATVAVPSDEATVILAIDTSRSMGARDVAPTRLAAAQTTARRFLAGLPGKYSAAVVAFGSRAQVVSVPTRDRAYVRAAINGLRIGEATALGDALDTAVKVATRPVAGSSSRPDGKTPPATVLVISDGAEDGGRVSLQDAVQHARAANVPVFAIGLGTEAGVVQVRHVGGYVERIAVPPDPDALRAAADATNGKFFGSPQTRDLSEVYADLKARRLTVEQDKEITNAFAGGAALLLLIGCALSVLWFRRVP